MTDRQDGEYEREARNLCVTLGMRFADVLNDDAAIDHVADFLRQRDQEHARRDKDLCPACGHPAAGNGEGGCAVEGCKCDYDQPIGPPSKTLRALQKAVERYESAEKQLSELLQAAKDLLRDSTQVIYYPNDDKSWIPTSRLAALRTVVEACEKAKP